MRLLFPNPWGFAPPESRAVEEMRARFGFSQAYADFLLTQNGVLFDEVDIGVDRYLAPSDAAPDERPDIRALYGLDSGSEHYELRDGLDDWMFLSWLFPIGADYGGNVYVEVLHGSRQGFVASLDHEMFLGNASLEDYLDDAGLDDFFDFGADVQSDFLTSPDTGLAWLHATNFKEFTDSCLHVSKGRGGFVVDSAGAREVVE